MKERKQTYMMTEETVKKLKLDVENALNQMCTIAADNFECDLNVRICFHITPESSHAIIQIPNIETILVLQS